jgi:hypothetical protein
MIRTFCIMNKMTFTAFHYLNLSIRCEELMSQRHPFSTVSWFRRFASRDKISHYFDRFICQRLYYDAEIAWMISRNQPSPWHFFLDRFMMVVRKNVLEYIITLVVVKNKVGWYYYYDFSIECWNCDIYFFHFIICYEKNQLSCIWTMNPKLVCMRYIF